MGVPRVEGQGPGLRRYWADGKTAGLYLLLQFCLRGGFLVISPNERLNVFDASVFALNPKTQRDDDILSRFMDQSSLFSFFFFLQNILMFHGRERIIRLSSALEPCGPGFPQQILIRLLFPSKCLTLMAQRNQ